MLQLSKGLNRTYEVTVNDVPIGNRREVKVEVFKAGSRLFVGSGTVNISSGDESTSYGAGKSLLMINISSTAATLPVRLERQMLS